MDDLLVYFPASVLHLFFSVFFFFSGRLVTVLAHFREVK